MQLGDFALRKLSGNQHCIEASVGTKAAAASCIYRKVSQINTSEKVRKEARDHAYEQTKPYLDSNFAPVRYPDESL